MGLSLKINREKKMLVEKYKHKDKEEYVEIVVDEDPMNPRTEWDNLGTMVCFHGKYKLGDETALKSADFDGWNALRKHLVEKEKAEIILPLYLYDHSGISMQTHRGGQFSCPFDSGQVGFIFVSKETIKKEKLDKEQARKVLEGEVEAYDQYLTGDIYGFKHYKLDSCEKCGHTEKEEINACWGFYGLEHIRAALKEDIENFKDFEDVEKKEIDNALLQKKNGGKK